MNNVVDSDRLNGVYDLLMALAASEQRIQYMKSIMKEYMRSMKGRKEVYGRYMEGGIWKEVYEKQMMEHYS